MTRFPMFLAILLLSFPAIDPSGSQDPAPLRYAPKPSETLSEVAARFSLSLADLERLNPRSNREEPGLLVLRGPRNREEAIEILEEARHAESQGGDGGERADALFYEILRAAALVDEATDSEAAREPIEIPSETVAQALLGWGRMRELDHPEKARWAYEQVEIFFPDLDEFTEIAESRLAALANLNSAGFAEPPPTALRWFPQPPHLLVDVDARKLEQQFSGIALYQGLRRLEASEEPEIVRLIDNIAVRDARIEKVLAQLESLHFGAWIDSELFGRDPDRGLDRMTRMAVGRLRVSPRQAAESLDLGPPTGEIEGYESWRLDRETILTMRDEWALLGEEETLRAAARGSESRSHPRLESPDSAYQRMRSEIAGGDALFVFADLEALLEGPALAFARNVAFDDKEGFALSLLLSGLLGANSAEGIGLGLDFEGGDLAANLALAHGGRGIFSLLRAGTCETRILPCLPGTLEGALLAQPGCLRGLEPLWKVFDSGWLGKAQPAFAAQYRTAVEKLGSALGSPVDPWALIKGGLGREIGIGIRLADSPLPFPNLILAAQVGDASGVAQILERWMTRQWEIVFSEGNVEGQTYRHGIVPEIPLYLDLAFAPMKETLLVATHSNLLGEAIRAQLSGESLEDDADYRRLSEALPGPDLARLYLSSDLTGRLASYGSSGLGQATIHESRPALRKIVKSTLAQVAADPQPSGLNFTLADDRVQVSLRLADFRSWLITALCVAEGRNPLEEPDEPGHGPVSQVEVDQVEHANPLDETPADKP